MGQNPTDRGQLGTTRRVLTDGHGLPRGVAIEGANRHAMQRVDATLAAILLKRPAPTAAQPQPLCPDKGYDGEAGREPLEAWSYTAHMRCRGEAAQAKREIPGDRARRWGGRTHARLDEPLSAVAHAVGEDSGALSRAGPWCLCLDHLSGG